MPQSTRRAAAICSAVLLAVFGTSMTVSLGVTAPLPYLVWALAVGAAVLSTTNPPSGPIGRS